MLCLFVNTSTMIFNNKFYLYQMILKVLVCLESLQYCNLYSNTYIKKNINILTTEHLLAIDFRTAILKPFQFLGTLRYYFA